MNKDTNTDRNIQIKVSFLPPGEATDRLVPHAGQGDEGSGLARL